MKKVGVLFVDDGTKWSYHRYSLFFYESHFNRGAYLISNTFQSYQKKQKTVKPKEYCNEFQNHRNLK